MRQFVAVTVLSAILAFGASAAFANDRVDYHPAFPSAQDEAIVNQADAVDSAVAGGSGPASVWSEMRYENYGQ